MRRSMLLPFWSRGQAEVGLGRLEKLSKYVLSIVGKGFVCCIIWSLRLLVKSLYSSD